MKVHSTSSAGTTASTTRGRGPRHPRGPSRSRPTGRVRRSRHDPVQSAGSQRAARTARSRSRSAASTTPTATSSRAVTRVLRNVGDVENWSSTVSRTPSPVPPGRGGTEVTRASTSGTASGPARPTVRPSSVTVMPVRSPVIATAQGPGGSGPSTSGIPRDTTLSRSSRTVASSPTSAAGETGGSVASRRPSPGSPSARPVPADAAALIASQPAWTSSARGRWVVSCRAVGRGSAGSSGQLTSGWETLTGSSGSSAAHTSARIPATVAIAGHEGRRARHPPWMSVPSGAGPSSVRLSSAGDEGREVAVTGRAPESVGG